jgi:hypothetical protein
VVKADADREVIMIDPFPEPPSFAGDGKPAADLVSLIAALFPALVNHALRDWPRIGQSDLDTLQSRIKARLEALVPILIERQTASKFLRVVLKIAAQASKSKIPDFVELRLPDGQCRRHADLYPRRTQTIRVPASADHQLDRRLVCRAGDR